VKQLQRASQKTSRARIIEAAKPLRGPINLHGNLGLLSKEPDRHAHHRLLCGNLEYLPLCLPFDMKEEVPSLE
jgi:hypothetical protein